MKLKIPQNLLSRKLLEQIKGFLDTHRLIIIIGARQVGKTSLLYLLADELMRLGKKDTIFYFDLEELELLRIFNQGVKEFLLYLASIGAKLDERNFILIDEIQYLDNPTNFLKLIADHHPNLNLICTGSSTLDIRRKFKDSLAGRKMVFELFPLDFTEFLAFKREDFLRELLLENNLGDTGVPDFDKIRFHILDFERKYEEFVLFGGYPRAVLLEEANQKIRYLTDIYHSYVRKDIKDIMRVDNIIAFNELVRLLSLQIGNLLNPSEACNSLNIARETLQRYLLLLTNTFILGFLPPFFTNRRKEIVKMQKVFFIDTGLRNSIIRNFNPLNLRSDSGALIENAIYSQLLKNLGILETLHFWRTQSKNEVDFILLKDRPIPLEVKYKEFKACSIPSGIHAFLAKYNPKYAFVLTKRYVDTTRSNDTQVIFQPIWFDVKGVEP